jgi:hypothetical protein
LKQVHSGKKTAAKGPLGVDSLFQICGHQCGYAGVAATAAAQPAAAVDAAGPATDVGATCGGQQLEREAAQRQGSCTLFIPVKAAAKELCQSWN